MKAVQSTLVVLLALGAVVPGALRADGIGRPSRSSEALPWLDSGFEESVDFATGPWQVRKARLLDPDYVTYSHWSFTIPATGGSPGGHVYINDNPDSRTGCALVGQHINLPPDQSVESVAIALDVKKACAYSNRGGGVAFALLTVDEWDSLGPSLDINHTPYWTDVTKLWNRTIWGIASPDYSNWTHAELPADAATALVDVLNAHLGEELVLAAYFYTYHYVSEWARFDNFVAQINFAPVSVERVSFGRVKSLYR